MSSRRARSVQRMQALGGADAGTQDRSLRQDYLLYLRDMAVAAVIFLPLWELLHLGRVLLTR